MKKNSLSPTLSLLMGSFALSTLAVAEGSASFDAMLSKYNAHNASPGAAGSPAAKHTKKRQPSAIAKAIPVAKEKPQEEPVAANSFGLSGDWGGLRSTLLDKGFTFEAVYKGDAYRSFNKELGNRSGYLDNIDLRARVDGEKTLGVKGLRFLAYGLGNHGDKPSLTVGDAQGTSNIETPYNTFKLYELYADQILWDGKTSFLLGLHDLNTEFYVTDSAGIFRNSSFGVGKELAQSGQNGPSIFPETSLAFRVKINPTPDFYWQTGIFDAIPGNPPAHYGTQLSLKASDGLLLVNEMGYTRANNESASLPVSKYALGMWSFTSPFDRADGSGSTAHYGYYFMVDQYLTSSLSGFFRQGWSIGDISGKAFASCTSLGINYRGLIPTRAQDRLGVATTVATTNDTARAAGAQKQETAIEVVYRAEVYNGVALIPDYQYVINPGATTANGNSQVIALRFEVSL